MCRLSADFSSNSFSHSFFCSTERLRESVTFKVDITKGLIHSDIFPYFGILFLGNNLDPNSLTEYSFKDFKGSDHSFLPFAETLAFRILKSSEAIQDYRFELCVFNGVFEVCLPLGSLEYESLISKIKGKPFNLILTLSDQENSYDFDNVKTIVVDGVEREILVLNESWEKIIVKAFSLTAFAEKIELEERGVTDIKDSDSSNELSNHISSLNNSLFELLSTVKKQQTVLYIIAVLLVIALFTR